MHRCSLGLSLWKIYQVIRTVRLGLKKYSGPSLLVGETLFGSCAYGLHLIERLVALEDYAARCYTSSSEECVSGLKTLEDRNS